MNPTIRKFGYPETLIADYRHWCVLLRPAQATLGALVLAAKDDAQSFAGLPPEAFAELASVSRDIEAGLSAFRPFDRLNWLMLMMVDRDVHAHVLPRYRQTQQWNASAFPDPGWPGPPNLSQAVTLAPADQALLVRDIRAIWPKQPV